MTRIERQMSIEAYREAEGISKSDLDLISRCPALYKYFKENPPEPTPEMIFGSAYHSYVLQPKLFAEKYVAKPEVVDRRSKAGKEAWNEFLLENEGKTILAREDYEQMGEMLEALMGCEQARKLLSGGEAELSVFSEKEQGLVLKARPDYVRPDLNALIDLKTTRDASFEKFRWSVRNFRYDVQAAFYLDVLNGSGLGDFDLFIFIAQEKKPPYITAIYYASLETVEAGRMKYETDLDTLVECLEKDHWPGYSEEMTPI